MGIELQISTDVVKTIAARGVQERLWRACFPPTPLGYVDHVDVAGDPVEMVQRADHVEIRVPADVYLVTDAELEATPNGTPAGASAVADHAVIVLSLAIAATKFQISCIDIQAASSGPALVSLKEALGTVAEFDLGPMLAPYGGANAAAVARVEFGGLVVALRFGTFGPVVGQLFPGQDWGLFLDGPAIEQLVKSTIPANPDPTITSFDVTPHWAPSGTTPHVHVTYSGAAKVPDPFSGDFDGTFDFDFSWAPHKLRATGRWTLKLHLGSLVPSAVEDAVANMLGSAFNAKKFGGIPLGERAFVIDTPFDGGSFGGGELRYANVLASPAGMTLGGPVRLPLEAPFETLSIGPQQFGPPSRVDFCSMLAKVGSGMPKKSFTVDELSTDATLSMGGCGSFCGYQILSPSEWVQPFVTAPAEGTVADPEYIYISIPSAGLLATADVRLIVRTSRGVRLIDLGSPQAPLVDPETGNVTNAVEVYVPDCLHIVPEGPLDRPDIIWGPRDDSGPDPIVPEVSWDDFLRRGLGLTVHLVTLSGLEPGELVQFRSPTHALDLTADHEGRLLVPALLGSIGAQRATLSRVTGGSFEGRFSVTTAIFQLQASISERTNSPADDASISSQFKQVRNPKAAPGPDSNRDGTEQRIEGSLREYTVPGFQSAPLRIASMANGSKLVLDLRAEGRPRVCGTFTGPIGELRVDRAEAASVDRDAANGQSTARAASSANRFASAPIRNV